MDFAQLIRRKRDDFGSIRDPKGINAVLRHLDSAEKHFERGRSKGDADLFTDVVYRTNQVFEGILKEVYQVLKGGNGHKRTPAQIEKYLENEAVFGKRVLDYFERYRKDWRNAAAHDHRIDFDEQEAFLAITTVSAFCYVAIDEMVRKLASDWASDAICSEDRRVDARHMDELAALLAEQLTRILEKMDVSPEAPGLSETLLLGALGGLLKSSGSDVQIVHEPAFRSAGRQLRLDLLLKQGDAKVVVEVKSVGLEQVSELVNGSRLREQLAVYAQAAEATGAIGVIFPTKLSIEEIPPLVCTDLPEEKVPTILIHPTLP